MMLAVNGQIHLLKGVHMQNANYNQRLVKKRPEKKHLFRHLILTTNWKYAFIMFLRECCEILGPCRVQQLQQILSRYAAPAQWKWLQVLQHFENKMSVLQTLYFFHSNKVKLLLSRFRQHHLVSRATEATRSRPRCSVSCHLTNVVKWPNVITNYLENDNVMLPKRREKKVRESSPCFCRINSFFFAKNVGETTFELKFVCESVSVKECVKYHKSSTKPPPYFQEKNVFNFRLS